MSNIYFICDNCGIETTGITLVNGMKFCYESEGNKQIVELQKQLDEKDKEIEDLEKKISWMEEQDMIFHNQLAIQELEKVTEDCFNQKELVDFGNVACFMVDIVDILEIINNQIKELKGE